MKVLIKQAKIISSSHPLNGQVKDIFIDDGIITDILDEIDYKADMVIRQKDMHISIGWIDIFADFGDPGYEYKETIKTGSKAAAAGGFTDVLIIPNTNPVIHNKSQVEYIIQQSKQTSVNLHPIGAVTKNTEGTVLSEMYDMYQSGAIAFSDGINNIQNPRLLLKALQYVNTIDGIIIQIPNDKTLSANGLMHEGIISTQIGLPGNPAMAEELMVIRDIELANYANSSIHFTGISSPKSIEYIKKAKEIGIKVSCSVTPYHLHFCDEELQTYDTNLKVTPPLRTRTDILSLHEAVMKGEIDFIASHHLPQHQDHKACEFEHAKYGMIGLESLFGSVWRLMHKKWLIEKYINLLSIAPRKIFGLPIPQIKEGEKACLTLFNPMEDYVFTEKMIQSKSKNSPFIGKSLKGKVVGIINKNQIYLNN